MIVKNEERFLRGCLESVRGVVDEMVIVDTGSTDGTQDLVRVFDAFTGREMLAFVCADSAADLTFSPDGRWLASVRPDDPARAVRLWDAVTGREEDNPPDPQIN